MCSISGDVTIAGWPTLYIASWWEELALCFTIILCLATTKGRSQPRSSCIAQFPSASGFLNPEVLAYK